MASTYVSQQDETLCTIAVDNGFANCLKLRDANPSITQPLKPGTTVNIPDLTDKKVSKATGAKYVFERDGIPKAMVYFVQDDGSADGLDLAFNTQTQLAISNYVTGRQGSGYAALVWKKDDSSDYDADASADPDHFKILVRDDDAAHRSLSQVTVDLIAQTPTVDATNAITAWNDYTGAGTSLKDIVCRRVADDSPWYKSCYLRLVVDPNDQNNRLADGTDPADDRATQTLVVPPLAINDTNAIEILDARVMAQRISPKCKVDDAAKKCRAYALADVGKGEMTLNVKVCRIGGGAAPTTITDAEVNTLLFTNYRMTLAQANIGIQIVDNKIYDVPLPNNMITVSDYAGVKGAGDGSFSVTVALAAGNVTVTQSSSKKAAPQDVANALSILLTAQGAVCRVSPNPPNLSSANDFGSCDLLVFNPDNTPAQIIAAASSDSAQKLAHTGAWNNGAVRDGAAEYGANEPNTRFINGMDYRAAAKNYNFNNTDHLTVMLVNTFAPMANGNTLLGFALIPYRDATAKFRPVAELQMAVFLDKNGVGRRTVLPHEAGHVLLDAIHTTIGNPEADWAGNVYPTNPVLGFSEWMAAFSRESSPPFLHLRMSDAPLTVSIQTVFGNLLAKTVVLGAGGLPAPVERLRTLSSSALAAMRELTEAPS